MSPIHENMGLSVNISTEEYNDFNRPALEPIMDLIVVKAKVKTLREGDLLCHACVEPLFQAHRRRHMEVFRRRKGEEWLSGCSF